MTEIIDALPRNTFSRTQKRSRAQMEEAVFQLPETAHVALARALEHAVHTKKREGYCQMFKRDVVLFEHCVDRM
jgi:hypothetical protein